jgi:hypothetical protein
MGMGMACGRKEHAKQVSAEESVYSFPHLTKTVAQDIP